MTQLVCPKILENERASRESHTLTDSLLSITSLWVDFYSKLVLIGSFMLCSQALCS